MLHYCSHVSGKNDFLVINIWKRLSFRKKKVPKEDSTFMFSHFLLYSLRLLPEQSTKNTSSTNKHIYKTSGFQSIKTYLISMWKSKEKQNKNKQQKPFKARRKLTNLEKTGLRPQWENVTYLLIYLGFMVSLLPRRV